VLLSRAGRQRRGRVAVEGFVNCQTALPEAFECHVDTASALNDGSVARLLEKKDKNVSADEKQTDKIHEIPNL
jgi:hypothetical protein